MSGPLGVVEIGSWSVGMLAADAMSKAASVRLLSAELNDLLGVVVRLTADDLAAVRAAVDAAKQTCEACSVSCITDVIARPAAGTWQTSPSTPEYNPLIEQDVVHLPSDTPMAADSKNNGQAIGFIETQGFTAVIEAIDAACKTANVEVVGREKLGGGFISVVIRGDVAAVKAAVDAGKARVEGLGKLIAAHVIARPSASVLALLPKA